MKTYRLGWAFLRTGSGYSPARHLVLQGTIVPYAACRGARSRAPLSPIQWSRFETPDAISCRTCLRIHLKGLR